MKKILWVLFYCFLFSLLLYNSFSYLDPDFGWHLRFGEIIWKTWSVPHDQIFMWSLAGSSWVDHEWLANLFLYGLWSIGGYIFVSIVFALIPLLTIFLINHYLFKYYIEADKNKIVIALLEIIILFVMKPHLGIRVQEFTLLGITLLFFSLLSTRSSVIKTPPWWLPVFFYVWACLHAGFLIGLTILFIWVVILITKFFIPRLFSKEIPPPPKSILYQWLFISGLSFLSTLLTPYGLSLYSFLSGYQDSFYQTKIAEWLPPYAFPIKYGQILLNSLVISSTLALYFIINKKNLVFNYIIVTLFLIMGFKSVRHFPLLMISWLILIVPHLLPEIMTRFKLRTFLFIKIITFVLLLIFSFYFFYSAKYTTTPFTSYCNNYTCGAVTFLKEHPEYRKKLLNPYNVGGFMIGVAPEIPLFIDGRLPQYKLGTHSILEEYYEFFKPELVRKKIEEYSITSVLLQHTPSPHKPDWFEEYFFGYVQNNTISPLVTYIRSSTDWQKVYEDTLSNIYVKK